MKRLILVYGTIAGAILVASIVVTMGLEYHSMVVGYLSMLAALTMVFVGVKRYRDEHLGGAIRFTAALGVGFGIALVASLFYVLAWEVYLYATDYAFMAEYTAEVIEARRAEGASAAELAKMRAEFDAFRRKLQEPAGAGAADLHRDRPGGAARHARLGRAAAPAQLHAGARRAVRTGRDMMAKVLGLGGLFFKSADTAATCAWYNRVLGIEFEGWGGTVSCPKWPRRTRARARCSARSRPRPTISRPRKSAS